MCNGRFKDVSPQITFLNYEKENFRDKRFEIGFLIGIEDVFAFRSVRSFHHKDLMMPKLMMTLNHDNKSYINVQKFTFESKVVSKLEGGIRCFHVADHVGADYRE